MQVFRGGQIQRGPGWDELTAQQGMFDNLAEGLRAIQAEKERRKEESFLTNLTDMLSYTGAQPEAGAEGPAGPSFSDAVSSAGRTEPKGGLAGFFDTFNPTTPSGRMTGAQRNILGTLIQQQLSMNDPKYQYELSRQKTTDQYAEDRHDWAGDAAARGKTGESRAVKTAARAEQDQLWQKEDRSDPLTNPRAKSLRHSIDQLWRRRDTYSKYTDEGRSAIARVDKQIAIYQKELDKMIQPESTSKRPSPQGTYAESRQRHMDKQGKMPPSWGAWFPKLSPQDQEGIMQYLQQGMSPEEVEARLKAKGILQ